MMQLVLKGSLALQQSDERQTRDKNQNNVMLKLSQIMSVGQWK